MNENTEALIADLAEIRKVLALEVKLRSGIIKPLENALRGLKDAHKNAVVLAEACVVLENPPAELELPANYHQSVQQLKNVADENLSELEFTFARDLREAFNEKGITLGGNSASELVAELFAIKVDMRRKQVDMTFSRQPVTDKKIKLDVEQVVAVYERARKEICERNVDLKMLLSDLFEAYNRVLKLTEKSVGTRTIIVDCYRELILVRQPAAFRKTPSKGKFLDYPKTHFAFDMMQLRRSQQMTLEGHRLNLGTATIDVGSDSARAMFLATDALEGQFIQHLYFTKE
ncbi:MAG: hypothetical protein M3Q78_12390 [Acidobacteriota bacterium]|nr:hypothetical protein [Acidobacteriota bacterium]